MISIIVAASENGVIGNQQEIPWYLPADLKHFANVTKGNTVIMGRKTFDSIISKLGKPLPDRENIIITRQTDIVVPPGVICATSLEDALTKATRQVFICGGGEIYRAALPIADKVYLTRVHTVVEGNITFPELAPAQWQRTHSEECTADEKNQYNYTFEEYERTT